jgi:hypothetical protein
MRWEGVVDELVDADWLGCRIVAVDHEAPEMWCELPRSRLPDAIVGTVFTWYAHRRGKKIRHVIRPKDFGAWTEPEVVEIEKWARIRSAWFRRHVK